jgi:hypothetical protein
MYNNDTNLKNINFVLLLINLLNLEKFVQQIYLFIIKSIK